MIPGKEVPTFENTLRAEMRAIVEDEVQRSYADQFINQHGVVDRIMRLPAIAALIATNHVPIFGPWCDVDDCPNPGLPATATGGDVWLCDEHNDYPEPRGEQPQ